MEFSFWEIENWFTNVDYTIVGSGIVGLNTALSLRRRFPKAKILILEKGLLPQGASTKNAGFACFGSVSEILDDLKNQSEEKVYNLVKKRWEGLQLLRKNMGDHNIGFETHGGYELFLSDDTCGLEHSIGELKYINSLLYDIFKSNVFSAQKEQFDFKQICDTILFNPFEAQIDTGKLMHELLRQAVASNILILNQVVVTSFEDLGNKVAIQTDLFEILVSKLLFATNGFAADLTNGSVQPARAQVLITKPIPNLQIKGTFHIDKGYYYFRNINQRILLGGGRNLNFAVENTTNLGQTDIVQNKLEEMLNNVILPNQKFEIDHRWSGIMGVGRSKDPIVSQISNNVYCGVRLGGMGVAIGSLIGKELADLI